MSDEADELVKKAEALYLDAAIMLTRLDKRMQRAVRLVMVDKKSVIAAAKAVHRHRNNVYRALAAVKPKLERVKKESAENA